MKNKLINFSIFMALSIISLEVHSESKKVLYIMGGGGEPKGSATIFDYNLKSIGKFSNNSDWQTTISFNGGHDDTEKIVSTIDKAKNLGAFTKKTFNDILDEAIKKIESGELGEGDQLMLSLETHGLKKSRNGKTHPIAVSDGGVTYTYVEILKGATSASLDGLEKLAKLAAEKGVKLALIDVSCFSGNLLNIDSEKTCMISATGRNQYGYLRNRNNSEAPNAFGDNFFEGMKKGKNLEEIFLDARNESDAHPDFPMISTEEGRTVNDLLYKMLSPFFDFKNNASTFFEDQYLATRKFETLVCEIGQNHQQLDSLLKKYEEMTGITDKLQSDDFRNLRDALGEYRKFQLNYEAILRSKSEAEAEVASLLKTNFSFKTYKPLDFIEAEYDESIAFMEVEMKEHPEAKGLWEETILEKRKEKEMALVVKSKLSESSKKKIQDDKDAYENLHITYDLARKVSAEARKVYQNLYKMQKDEAKSNPCRDFVL
jgi:hypothetical protein